MIASDLKDASYPGFETRDRPRNDSVKEKESIRCRVAACLERLGDGKEWSFYLLNDGGAPLDLVVLKTFGHEWGDAGYAKHPGVEVADVAPGAGRLIWRDNDDEFRMWLTLLVRAGDREVELLAELPMLYRRKSDLPLVAGLDKPGWVVPAVESGGNSRVTP